ncbi:MAG TPA: serine hydrolase [Chloroflexota bacterium]|nr:serine hydrolase [Chloroflexota bacterium]
MRRSARLLIASALCAILLLGPFLGRASAEPAGKVGGLQSSLEQYLAGKNADYGVYVLDLDDSSRVDINGEDSFPTASMYKLLVLYRVAQAIDRGALSPDQTITITDDDLDPANPEIAYSAGDTPTVADALDQMITVSDNGAAFALTRAVGGWSWVASAAPELGMDNTVFTDDFYSTPQDFAHFFRLLANRQLVSPAATDLMISLLENQTVDDRIPALLPGDTWVAHKTGELPEVRNDGGIVRCASQSYVVVMMSKNGDPDEEIPAEAQMSGMIYNQICG